MPLILPRQEPSLLKEPRLTTDPNGCIKIIRQLLVGGCARGRGSGCGCGLDEGFESVDVACFGVAV